MPWGIADEKYEIKKIYIYIQLYSVPPGFIRFALIRSFSYSFGATAFDDCNFFFFFTFKHFASL